MIRSSRMRAALLVAVLGLVTAPFLIHFTLAASADEAPGVMPDGMMHMHGDGQMPMQGSDQMPMHGDGQMPMQGNGMMQMQQADKNAPASTKAFIAANNKMHAEMTIQYTGNADNDFVRGMIPHHQGAVDMAKIALEYGKDPQIRALAEGIIKAQESEIAMMKAWLAAHPK